MASLMTSCPQADSETAATMGTDCLRPELRSDTSTNGAAEHGPLRLNLPRFPREVGEVLPKVDPKNALEYVPSHKRIWLILSGNTIKTLRSFLQAITFGLQETQLSCRPCQQNAPRHKSEPNNKTFRQASLKPASVAPPITKVRFHAPEKRVHPPKTTKLKSSGRECRVHQQSIRPLIHRCHKHMKETSTLPMAIGPQITKLDVKAKQQNAPPPIYKNARGTQQLPFQTIILDFDKSKEKRPIQQQSTHPPRTQTHKTNHECSSYEKNIHLTIHSDARQTSQDLSQSIPLGPYKTQVQTRPHQQKKNNLECRHNQHRVRPPNRKDCKHGHQEISKGLKITQLECPNRQTVHPIRRCDKDIQQAVVQPITLVPDISQLQCSSHQHGPHQPIDKPTKVTKEDIPDPISTGLRITEVKCHADQPFVHTSGQKDTCDTFSHITRVEFCPNLKNSNKVHTSMRHTWPVDPKPISLCLQITPL
ncbi:uncharacterized protein LOC127597205 [Hippocampus zosterae]|uniref:uncharacterized protein LOC127597205 n=1 Tax=Hippocampus zosterae TaxID=109293 RepID=UPI00223E3D63|nr:uncharacterized protein LOC127597205 [Hippocampus zosterae]